MNRVAVARPMDACEKLLLSGPESLSDIELLTFFIQESSKQSPLELALEWMKKMGNLRDIINSDLKKYLQVSGLKSETFLQLQAAREISRRSDFIKLKKLCKISSTADSAIFLKRKLRDKRNEIVAALFLDSQYRLISYEELFHGSINATTVFTRPIIEKVLEHNAAALILAHNHPSGESKPSSHDLKLTRRIERALALVETKLLDHLVVGDNEIYSIMNHSSADCH
jgi:DNA repair protein RadC